ncbi:hypothetical protein BC828DRAFT_392136 [Blastocladiella britannica]|nr:hypothetical protein BC828DRAFT_392136 [Blastocladiella britannica]
MVRPRPWHRHLLLLRTVTLAAMAALAASYLHADLAQQMIARAHTQYLGGLVMHASLALVSLLLMRVAGRAAWMQSLTTSSTSKSLDPEEDATSVSAAALATGHRRRRRLSATATASDVDAGAPLQRHATVTPNVSSNGEEEDSSDVDGDGNSSDPGLLLPTTTPPVSAGIQMGNLAYRPRLPHLTASGKRLTRSSTGSWARGRSWLWLVAIQATLLWAAYALRSSAMIGLHNPWIPFMVSLLQFASSSHHSLVRLLAMLCVSSGAHLVLVAGNLNLSSSDALAYLLDAGLRALALLLLVGHIGSTFPPTPRSQRIGSGVPPNIILSIIGLCSLAMATINGLAVLHYHDWSGASVRMLFLHPELLLADLGFHFLAPFFYLSDYTLPDPRDVELPSTGPTATETTFMYLTAIHVARRLIVSSTANSAMVLTPLDEELVTVGQVIGAALVAMGVLWVAAHRPSKPIAVLFRTIALAIAAALMALIVMGAYSAATLSPDSGMADEHYIDWDTQASEIGAILDGSSRTKDSIGGKTASGGDMQPDDGGSGSPIDRSDYNGTLASLWNTTGSMAGAWWADPVCTHALAPAATANDRRNITLHDIEESLAACRAWVADHGAPLHHDSVYAVGSNVTVSSLCLDVSVIQGQVLVRNVTDRLDLSPQVLSTLVLLQEAVRTDPLATDALALRFILVPPQASATLAGRPGVWAPMAPSVPQQPDSNTTAATNLAFVYPFVDALHQEGAAPAWLDPALTASGFAREWSAREPAPFILGLCDPTRQQVEMACKHRATLIPATCEPSSSLPSSNATLAAATTVGPRVAWPVNHLLALVFDLMQCGTLVSLDEGMTIPQSHWSSSVRPGQHLVAAVPSAFISDLAHLALLHPSAAQSLNATALFESLVLEPLATLLTQRRLNDTQSHNNATTTTNNDKDVWDLALTIARRGHALAVDSVRPSSLRCFLHWLLLSYAPSMDADVRQELVVRDRFPDAADPRDEPNGIFKDTSLSVDQIMLQIWREWWEWQQSSFF